MKFNKLKYSYSRGGVDNFDSTGNSRVFGVEPANMDDIERPYNKKYDYLFSFNFLFLVLINCENAEKLETKLEKRFGTCIGTQK